MKPAPEKCECKGNGYLCRYCQVAFDAITMSQTRPHPQTLRIAELQSQVRTLQEENEAMRVVLSDARKEAMAVGGALRMGTATRSRLGRLAAKIRLALEPAALSSKTETA